MTQNIKERLDELFELILPLSVAFNKNTYEENFKTQYERFRPFFKELEESCKETAEMESFLEEVSDVIPNRLKEIISKESSKRKKEQVIMKYNLGMVSFIIPMFRYGRLEYCEEIVDRMIVKWNDNGTSMEIGKSTFEEIQGGFKNHMCYITTAVCRNLGKEDDCYELELLREYRDQYLMNQEDGKELVENYYDIAPTLVNRIDKKQDANQIYQGIWETYLSPCIELIEQNKMEECREVYSDMVYSLKNTYIYS